MTNLLDIVDIVGRAVDKYDGKKMYVSTGALAEDTIDKSKCDYYTYDEKPSRANLQVLEGDIIFAKMQGTKKTLIIDKDTMQNMFSTGFCAIKPKKSIITTKCLYYLISSEFFLKNKDKNCSGATQKAITNEGLSKIYIKLPQIEEQEKICKYLDRIVDLNRKYRKQIELYDTLIKARFVEMFGDIETTKYPIKRLEEVTEFIKDGTHNTPEYTQDIIDGYKFLSSKDVTSERINWNNVKYIPKNLHDELYKRIHPQRNDILLAKNGTYGVCAIVDNDEVFDIYVSLALIRLKKDVLPIYMWVAINSPMSKAQFDENIKGVGVPNLHLSEIKKTNVIIPPVELQEKFCNFVKEVDKLKFE